MSSFSSSPQLSWAEAIPRWKQTGSLVRCAICNYKIGVASDGMGLDAEKAMYERLVKHYQTEHRRKS